MNYDRLLGASLITLLGAQLTASVDPAAVFRPPMLAAALLWCVVAGVWATRELAGRIAACAIGALLFFTGLESTVRCCPRPETQRLALGSAEDDYVSFIVTSRPERPAPGLVRFRALLPETGAEVLLDAADVPWSSTAALKLGDEGRGLVRLKFVIAEPLRPPPVFSYEAYLFRRGMIASGKLLILEDFFPATREMDGRSRFILSLVSRFQSTPALAVILASTLAEEDLLDDTTEHLFRNTGLTHVLVVSGYQVGVLFLIMFRALRFLLGRSERLLTLSPLDALAAGGAFLGACGYAALTGGPLTAVRAVFSLAVLALGRSLSRRAHTWRSFGAVVLVSLLIWPGASFEAGCQLMFAALLGLIAAARFETWLVERTGLHEKLAALIAVSVLPAVMTTPVVMAWFEVFIPHAVLFNLLFAPLMSIVCTAFAGFALFFESFEVLGSEVLFAAALELTRVILFFLATLESALRECGLRPIELEGRALFSALTGSALCAAAVWAAYFWPRLRNFGLYAKHPEADQGA